MPKTAHRHPLASMKIISVASIRMHADHEAHRECIIRSFQQRGGQALNRTLFKHRPCPVHALKSRTFSASLFKRTCSLFPLGFHVQDTSSCASSAHCMWCSHCTGIRWNSDIFKVLEKMLQFETRVSAHDQIVFVSLFMKLSKDGFENLIINLATGIKSTKSQDLRVSEAT